MFNRRLEKIKQLKTELAAEEKIEQDTLRYMKDRGDVFIMFRYCCLDIHKYYIFFYLQIYSGGPFGISMKC